VNQLKGLTMTNLIVALDKAVIQKARIRALKEGTSLEDIVRGYLVQYAQAESSKRPGQGFLDMAKESNANASGASWHRENAYDRADPSAC
jgi:plasmid stability protein